MATDLKVKRTVNQAVTRGRYLIMITSINPKTNKLNHYWTTQNFPGEDIVSSINHLTANIIEKLWPGSKMKEGLTFVPFPSKAKDNREGERTGGLRTEG